MFPGENIFFFFVPLLRGRIATLRYKNMSVKILFLLCLSILAVAPTFAQTKAVTNEDLEKFRQKRLRAEKDYRENYAKMGFPSPEELERQNEKSRVEREELSARLTAERLQREKAEAERAEIARYNEQIRSFNSDNPVVNDSAFHYGYSNTIFYGWRFPRYRQNHFNYPISVGNGIPIVNYYGQPHATVRVVQPPSSRWLRR